MELNDSCLLTLKKIKEENKLNTYSEIRRP